jgi:ABC-type Fe3+ transport system substrate-binding protein
MKRISGAPAPTARHAALVALCVGALVMTGCAGGGGSPSSSDSAGASHDWTNLDDLVKAAKAESGPLNVYIAPEYSPFAGPGFEKAYPWAKLNITELEPVPAVAKFSAEVSSGFSNADVVFMHSTGVQTFKDSKSIAQVTVPNDSGIVSGLQDPDHYFHAVVQLPEVILYNKNLVSDPPTTIKELSSAKWKDKLVMDLPQLGGAGGFVMASERKPQGDSAWQSWLQKVEDNQPTLTSTSSDSYATVVRGDKPICICGYGDFIGQDPGTPVGVSVYGQGSGGQGVVVEPIVGVVNKSAPHPALAALFLNWMLAKDGGQAGFVASGRTPAVPTTPGAEKVNLPKGTKVLPLTKDLGDYIKDPNSFNTIFKQIFQ